MERIKTAVASIWQALRRWVKEQEANHQAHVAYVRTHCTRCGRGTEDGVRVCEMCNRCNDSECNIGCMFCRETPAQPVTCPCCGQELPHQSGVARC